MLRRSNVWRLLQLGNEWEREGAAARDDSERFLIGRSAGLNARVFP
jgi:hypothetical protein